MKLIKHSDIFNLNIPVVQYMQWVKEALLLQYKCIIPAKTSMHLPQDGFFNTMPCCIPDYDVMGVKMVNRYTHRNPALDATIMLYDYTSGELKSIMDGTLITTMRTGAVAATSIIELKKKSADNNVAIMGLGVTGRATLMCLLESLPQEKFQIKLKRYKQQAEAFIKSFEHYENASFSIVDDYEQLIVDSDIIISCITSADQLYGRDEWFKEGVLLVPVHTRGFQNCDLFFDKVFGDVTSQISGFGNFSKFRYFDEFAKVVIGDITGRDNEAQRILVYNIGMALHDIYIADKIYQMINRSNLIEEADFKEPLAKFYI